MGRAGLLDTLGALSALMEKADSDSYPLEEAQQRLKAILRGAFSTPPKPLKDIPKQNGVSRSAAKKSPHRAA
jgi:hypothetical protein